MNTEYKKPEFCNQCPNHCPADDLHCGRGRAYFVNLENAVKGEAPAPVEERGPRGEHGPHGEHRPRGEHGFRGHRGMHHPRPEINKQSSLETLLRACGHRLHRSMPGGPHGSQEHVLRMLADQGTPIDQRVLLEAMHVRPASASELLAKLEEKGYILRERDAEDRRRARVSLTEAGAAKAAEAAPVPAADLFEALSQEEQDTLRGLLLKLLESWK